MTTAHRPTWKAAVGRAQEGGWSSGGAISTASSARDLAAHTKLKFRSGPQLVGDRNDALRESLLKMEEAERHAKKTAKTVVKMEREKLLLENGAEMEKQARLKLLNHTADVDEEKIKLKYNDDDDGGSNDVSGGWSDLDVGEGRFDNESVGSDLDTSDDDDDDDDLDSDDEDEEAALQAELAKIRAERAAAKAQEEAEVVAEEQARMEEAALTGNPLLSSGGLSSSSGRLKRRWNDDVVFRNQARGEPNQNKKRFINDTVRNDFHRRFLNKFIR